MKESGGLIITVFAVIIISVVSFVGYEIEKKNCGCKPETIFNTPLKEIFEK